MSSRHLFNVLDHGARADRVSNDAAAIQRTLDAACDAGGGIVEVPPGDYRIGTIRMRPRVTLYLHAGATLHGSDRREDYTEPCLVYGEDADDFAVRGQGRIDGNGLAFVVDRDGRNVIPKGHWRPSRMVQFINCHNVLLEDVQLTNSPAWTLHPIDCDRMTIRGISIINGINKEKPGEDDHVPNADGIDPDGCSNMRISDCFIQSGDDSIVLKISKRSKTRECRDITVTNCVLVSTETALKIGSETNGTFRNITFSNCTVRDAGCGVGLWMRDGGTIDGWLVSHITMTLPFNGVPIYLYAWKREQDTPFGTVRNVTIRDVTATGEGAVFITGVREKPMEGVTLENLRLHVAGSDRERYHDDPPHPFQVWGHRRTPYDIYARYVSELKLRNVRVTWAEPERPAWGSAVRLLGIDHLDVDGFEGRQTRGSDAPVMHLRDVRDALIRHCRPMEGANAFVHLDEGCDRVTLIGNDLSHAREPVTSAPGVPPSAVFETANRPPRGIGA